MKICGLQKVTLLDYPGHVAATVFIGGCNFNCPFCYNSSLINNDADEVITEEEFFEYLGRRKGILDGVAITGGEPLLHKEIVEFIRKIKALGFKVKLDTNGSFPDVLEYLVNNNLVDYVAMDIKNTLDKYCLIAGCNIIINNITRSIKFLINSDIDYEFRTTVVREYHEISDFIKIGELIKGAKKYFIQSYQYQESVRNKNLTPLKKDELLLCMRNVEKYVGFASLREID